jgi:hypothetical protein
MGFDISYHPISENEINNWYFDRLPEIMRENLETVQDLAQKFEISDFYANKYITTLRAGVTSLKNGNEPFDKTHGFYAAVTQGFFRTFFYTRGSAFSFLINKHPHFQTYTKTWQDILGKELACPTQNIITENYSSGVFLPYEQIERLYREYSRDVALKEQLEENFSHGRIGVFLKAVSFCLDNKLGLLEATEVAEPNPMELNKSVSYSDFFNHCDKDGPYLYQEAALIQMKEILDNKQ